MSKVESQSSKVMIAIKFLFDFFIFFGANCPLVFAIAIPAFGYISPLRCEDTASIGAKGRIIFLLLIFCQSEFIQSEFISDSNPVKRVSATNTKALPNKMGRTAGSCMWCDGSSRLSV
jgi:hypothetical protein